jgi:hypothetical protein
MPAGFPSDTGTRSVGAAVGLGGARLLFGLCGGVCGSACGSGSVGAAFGGGAMPATLDFALAFDFGGGASPSAFAFATDSGICGGATLSALAFALALISGKGPLLLWLSPWPSISVEGHGFCCGFRRRGLGFCFRLGL